MLAVDRPNGPLVEFFQLVPNTNPPRRADKSVGGVIPARTAIRSITSASAWLVSYSRHRFRWSGMGRTCFGRTIWTNGCR